jgi:Tfp pilus assembly protein PilP
MSASDRQLVRRFPRRRGVTLAFGLSLAVAVSACAEEQRSATRGTAGAAPASAAATVGSKAREALFYQDDDFVESPQRRDPFRAYTATFRAKAPEDLQRQVVMPATSVEEMRLIALVTGTARPKAMLLDPAGVGHVVERGDYLGRPKLIQATGNVSMTINWRVDRIRENEVVLTQQDPADPSRVALTKILPLNEEVAAR